MSAKNSVGSGSMTFVVYLDLWRRRSVLRGNNGPDRASLGPKALSAQESPSDLHYIVGGAALLVSAGIGVLVASQIVLALGYAG
jgi:hypothetical protein